MSGTDHPPLSRPISVDGLPARGQMVRVVASAEECEGLAALCGIVAIGKVEAELLLAPWRRTGVKLTGTVSADVVQECVVTLEPVDQKVEERVEITFLPGARPVESGLEIEIDPEADDPPEPLEGGVIDVGVIVAEYVALGLDPYPRKAGVTFEDRIEDDGSDDNPRPFAGLKDLTDKGQG